MKNSTFVLVIMWMFVSLNMSASISLPHIFSDHMVLQRNHKTPVWGKADKGEKVTLTIAGQKLTTIANEDGKWKLYLNPMAAGGPFTMIVQGKNKITFTDVLVGEVWVCAGQSNMEYSVENCNDSELEIASANYPQIRLMRVPQVTSQKKQYDIDSTWYTCTPKTISKFSANGYFFGRKLYNTLNVPIGLINVSWGASSLETWISREAMETANQYKELLEDWDLAVNEFNDEMLKNETLKYEKWEEAGKPGEKMKPPRDIRTGQNRPANGFNAMINPIAGYGIKGVIWCQGESNLGRAYQHRSLFKLLITSWRDLWKQGDFSFYWVQLADFNKAEKEPCESMWAEFRESQTMALSLPNTGEAITMDLGEERDIHFRNKQTSANRLVRHALAKDYGYKMVTESPRYSTMEIKGSVITITFANIDKGLYTFDVTTVKGFSIAGKDKKFVWAEAKIIGKNKVEVYSDAISEPVAVRYGWANNPEINLYDFNGLPVTGFRTDDWPMPSINNKKANRRY